MNEFSGFVRPKSNYFSVPNDWTDITHDITSLAVMKLVEYVLRHTWGWHGQEDQLRRISIDEFANGRKKKGGDRLDRGTGLSPGAISIGLRTAMEQGYLIMEEDKTDAGRTKRYYALRMRNEDSDPQNLNSDPQNLNSDPQNMTKQGLDFEDEALDFGGPTLANGGRTKKDNRKKNKRLERQVSLSDPTGSDGQNSSSKPSTRKKHTPTAWDERAAWEFAEVVKSHRPVQKNSDLRKWADVFRRMREVDGVRKKTIRDVIEWYGEHIGEEYVPEAFSAATFRQKFAEGKFTSAMRREQNGHSSNGKKLTRQNMWDDPDNLLPGGILKVEVGSDGERYDGRLLHKIRRRVLAEFGRGRPLPEELESLLKREFPKQISLTPAIIGSVG